MRGHPVLDFQLLSLGISISLCCGYSPSSLAVSLKPLIHPTSNFTTGPSSPHISFITWHSCNTCPKSPSTTRPPPASYNGPAFALPHLVIPTDRQKASGRFTGCFLTEAELRKCNCEYSSYVRDYIIHCEQSNVTSLQGSVL